MWLIHAAPVLYTFSKQNKSFEGQVGAPGPSLSKEAWTGFTQARWNTWLHELKDVQMGVSDQKTARLVQEAVEAMESAEK